MKDEFRDETGEEPDWPEHTATETFKILKARGLGGTVVETGKAKQCYGYEVAIHLARKYAPDFHSTKMGRGSAFYEDLDALKEAGK